MIQLHHISKSYGDKIILEDVSCTIHTRDRIGIIGKNGTGKSTLFQIILGREEPDDGTVTVTHEELGYLPQQLSYKPKDTIYSYLQQFLHEEWESYKIDMCLAEVELDIPQDTCLANLSGGQKTKVGLAALLMSEPTTLLLDEPTNNLDLETLKWLETFLKKYKGTVLIISHDRAFLDNTVTQIFELNSYSHDIEQYSGGYTDYCREKERRYEKQMSEFKDFVERKKEMEAWIHLKQEQLKVYRNPKVARQLQAMKTRFEREILANTVEKPQVSHAVNITQLGEELYHKRVLFHIKDLIYKNLFTSKMLTIRAGDRIHLQGGNGVGKTSFIHILLGNELQFSGLVERGVNIPIGYFSQEHTMLDAHKTVIDEFMEKTGIGNEQQVRCILGGFHFTSNEVFKKVSHLSQGEKVKLIIAQLTYQKNQFLILDEPTNHLDIESREVLEKALQEYAGGFLLISHDRYFVNQVNINRVFSIENRKLYE